MSPREDSFRRCRLLRVRALAPIVIATAFLAVACSVSSPPPPTQPFLATTSAAPNVQPGEAAQPVAKAAQTPRPTATSATAPATLTVSEVEALLEGQEKPPVFDARPRAAYDAGHLPGAVSLPLDELDRRISEVPSDRLVIFYCSGKT